MDPYCLWGHYNDVMLGAIASQITSLTIVYSIVYSDTDQRKHQSSASLAFVWGIHRGPVNSPHKWPVTRKMFPFDDVIMIYYNYPQHLCAEKWQKINENTNILSYISKHIERKNRISIYFFSVDIYLMIFNRAVVPGSCDKHQGTCADFVRGHVCRTGYGRGDGLCVLCGCASLQRYGRHLSRRAGVCRG